MLLRRRKFKYVVVIKPGVDMYMAYTLSKAYIKKESSGQDKRSETEKEVETIKAGETSTWNNRTISYHSHEICTRLGEKIASDLFEFNQQDFLMTIDYYSDYIENDRANDKKGIEVIGILKKHFARYGLPDCVFSDNRLFSSYEFRHFSNQYELTHTSSPRFQQSNGKVINATKTANSLMVKSQKDAKDPYLALNQEDYIEKRRTYCNRSAKDKTKLATGDIVRIKQFKNGKEWTKAKGDEKCNIRSDNVTTEDCSIYRRNRRHLILSKEPMIEHSELDLPTQAANRTDNHA
ncbi:Hypothetical predicted protein [Mytilus galloprovincialis]|uniref:Integrase catalytic domain-containing protein n=1 Tax=Mytilus galloprovincialis TaxID=29158 RepID=A0A8B6CJL2_MYTGA|nr:Hypothetical predicted protein [Mytilus galloprovincialis]